MGEIKYRQGGIGLILQCCVEFVSFGSGVIGPSYDHSVEAYAVF